MRRLGMVALPIAAVLTLAGCNSGDDEGGDFGIELSGANEVCAQGQTCGDPDGSGTATVEINSDRNELCYELSLQGISGVTAAHIHEAPVGEAGDAEVDLEFSGPDGGADACLDGIAEDVLEEIAANPDRHYVNVHTQEFPDGAVRGQLEG